ncbi:MAG: DUF4424 domain-containing protein [Oricola sp.]
MLRLLVLLMLLATPALANDSVAEIGTGGIILAHSETISLDREDLAISLDRIDVSYDFRNHSDRDVRTIVAFPMPDIQYNPWVGVALPDNADDNFLGFTVMADGQPIVPALEQHAVAAGIDITDELKAHGVPLFPFGETAFQALASLPKETLDDWVARGIVVVNAYSTSADEPISDHYEPYWVLKSTYWWWMTFPAGQKIMVEHSYRPSVGGTAGVTFYEGGKFTGQGYDEYERRYCLDKSFTSAVARRTKEANAEYPPFTENRVQYVLTSGANWRLGTIGSFHLTVDKGSTDNLVSFCGEGVTKTGPTTFEMTKQDFYPEKDLEFLILQPANF